MISTRESQDLNAQLMVSYSTMGKTHNCKILAKVKKKKIPYKQFKGKTLATKKAKKGFQKEEEKENKIFVCLYFDIKELV